MGSNDTSKKKKRAIELRKNGKSYSQIMEELNIPSKGTLSYWFKDLSLSKSSQKLLEGNLKLAQERGLKAANNRRSKRIQKENKVAQEEGRRDVGDLSNEELKQVGAALYWAEGTKVVGSRSKSLEFANSDPDMIRLYVRFLREIIRPSEERIRAGIHIHKNISIKKAVNHWSKVTGLPKNRFFTVTSQSRASKLRRPKNRLEYGTVKIRFNDRKAYHRVMGMIEGLASKTRM